MTTNVPKGAGRATATARTRKHAQRTALPPKPGVVNDAREILGHLSEIDAALVEKAANALAEWVSHNAETDRIEDEAAMVIDSPATLAHGDAPDVRSWRKAKTFESAAVALGWKALKEARGEAVEVTVTRGAETVVQAWSRGLWQYDASVYAYGDRTTKPRNASGALKLLARSAGDAAAESNKVQTNRHFRKAEPKDIHQTLATAQARLPFDPELATDEEISGVLAGQAVVWYNRISRANESAIVGRSGVRITYLEDGQRVINFCCPVTGYRSCLVTALLKVGRGKSSVTKGSPTEGSAKVEVS